MLFLIRSTDRFAVKKLLDLAQIPAMRFQRSEHIMFSALQELQGHSKARFRTGTYLPLQPRESYPGGGGAWASVFEQMTLSR